MGCSVLMKDGHDGGQGLTLCLWYCPIFAFVFVDLAGDVCDRCGFCHVMAVPGAWFWKKQAAVDSQPALWRMHGFMRASQGGSGGALD
eukprot:366467-Chlamydomonas_euryale.AAC.5